MISPILIMFIFSVIVSLISSFFSRKIISGEGELTIGQVGFQLLMNVCTAGAWWVIWLIVWIAALTDHFKDKLQNIGNKRIL
jgi:hypothetical protein